jgi:hypothetical protein
MTIPIYPKDPSGKKEYSLDWSDWLGSDTISTSTWTVPSGITKVTDSKTTTTTTVWLSGGSTGYNYLCTNHIVTIAGREEDQSIIVKIQDS